MVRVSFVLKRREDIIRLGGRLRLLATVTTGLFEPMRREVLL